MNQQQAEAIPKDIIVDILLESKSLEEACEASKQLHSQGVRLERLKSNEQVNKDRIKTTYRKIRKTRGYKNDGTGDIVYMQPESVGGNCCCIIL